MRRNIAFSYLRDDTLLIIATALLLALSVLMVFSTTAVSSGQEAGDSTLMIRRHLLQIGFGIVALIAASRIPVRSLYRASLPLLIFSFVSLVLVRIPGIGHVAGGARRWLVFGPIRVQPAEYVKFIVVLYISAYIGRHHERMLEFVPGALVPLSIVALFAVLLLLQPDFGSTAILLFVVFFQLVTVSRLRHLMLIGAGAVAAMGLLVITSPYRFKRFESFLNPFEDASHSGYQLVQSLIAVGSGGFWGTGLGAGKQKLFYLPAAHTDFIFAVISEELGLIGAVLVVILFCMIARSGISLAKAYVDDPFRCSLAVGFTLLIVLPAFLNMGVVLGLLPTKGLVLPLVAYGGTAMVMNLAVIGVLLRLCRSVHQT